MLTGMTILQGFQMRFKKYRYDYDSGGQWVYLTDQEGVIRLHGEVGSDDQIWWVWQTNGGKEEFIDENKCVFEKEIDVSKIGFVRWVGGDNFDRVCMDLYVTSPFFNSKNTESRIVIDDAISSLEL